MSNFIAVFVLSRSVVRTAKDDNTRTNSKLQLSIYLYNELAIALISLKNRTAFDKLREVSWGGGAP